MTHHITDDLPRLLTGDASREETLAAAEHLRGCPDCQQELVSAVVAHASLSSARRFAPQAMRGSDADAEPEAAVLPDLSAVFAKARDEAAARPAPTRRRVLIAVAAAAVVATAAGVTIAETVGDGSSGSVAKCGIELRAYGVGTQPACATLTGPGTMRIDASALPRLPGRQFYEVWLTDAARTRMQAVGSFAGHDEAQLTVSPNVMSNYSAIEVSVQQVGQTDYSGTSVLRGSYG